MSILDPFTCGFIKVTTFEVLTRKYTLQQGSGEFEYRTLDNQYNTPRSIFGKAVFNVPFNIFWNKYHQIVDQK